MNKNLRWKVVTILVVLALAVWAFWPPREKVHLGLDLQGGVHLVLRVQTDDALRVETETTMERLREELARRNIAIQGVSAESPTRFQVQGVPGGQDAEFRRIADEQTQGGFNRQSGAGGTYTFELKPNVVVTLRDEAVKQALQTIERRVNELGVAEPVVAPYGMAGDQILVQLPGVSDVGRAKEIIRSTALLELKLVEQGPAPTREALLSASGGSVPAGMEVVSGVDADGFVGQPGGTIYYLVRRTAAITGRDLRNARPSLDENNRPAVQFSLNQEGARKFGRVTGENVGRFLAIILDGRVQSAPRIDSRITDEGRITGSFTQNEAQDLSLVLRSGALPASLTYLEERTVGPSLGADSVRAGIMASLVGLGLVAIFMLVYYKLAGINAIVSVAMNLVILLGFMAYVDATMTLPGVAGFILTIGMGVDSNVLIFERIKEEIGAGKGVKAAVAAGFDRVFLTILDTHVASLIAAGFLFQFGTGPIRGFATTLFFGLLSNVFTAVFVSRTLFELALSRRQAATLSI
ncbi:MAG: preprotein translocase subunit SecD [Acidobacteria bacterium]|jgi:preprotein translocase subunit SecD|nr:preprotein translocase subunit SecD [Acidobacteriota bacterium]